MLEHFLEQKTSYFRRVLKLLARIIWSWQCCRLFAGNIANGIASKNYFAFLTVLGNSKQKFFGDNAIGNVAKQKSAAMSREDDSGHGLFNLLSQIS